jgi:hypothetical protein
MSSSPSSGAMKPKPLASLNHGSAPLQRLQGRFQDRRVRAEGPGQPFLFDFAGYSPQDLRFADFNGDGITDVFVMFNCETIFANSDE